MWTPANTSALPSPEETREAKRSILQLETELANATVLLEQTQRRIDELNTDLKLRRAWIAPIRKIPFEVLPEIFIISAWFDQLAPVRIAAVCRHWRATILATPLAWSYIWVQDYPIDVMPIEYISMFLERSKPRLLHTGFQWKCSLCHHDEDDEEYGSIKDGHRKCSCGNIAMMIKHSHRIECLAIDCVWVKDLSRVRLPNLTRLTIVQDFEDPEMTSGTLDMAHLPRLRYLDISSGGTMINHCIRFSGINYPQLQHLDIEADDWGIWLELITHQASMLTTLAIRFPPRFYHSTRWSIECPNLTTLYVEDRWPESEAVLETSTPNLRYFANESHSIQVVHKSNPNTVVKLCTNRPPSLGNYLHLRVLEVRYPIMNAVVSILDQLERDNNLSPYLETIAYYPLNPKWANIEEQHAEERLAARNQAAGSNIEFTHVEGWSVNLAREEYECGLQLPCNRMSY